MMQSFTDLPSLDKYLERLDAAAKVSDDELRSSFNGFEWGREPTTHKDPYSLAFRDEQMDLYCKLAGVESYDTVNERSHFDVAEAVRRPFPYLTGSSHTVGDHLMGIGFLLKTANFRPESRILEFGPGWGNTTLALAQLGCRVTAVDIESNFVDLIRRRLTAVGLDVESVQGDFNVFCHSGRQFDAVVFFESFHHYGDHLKLLRSLERLVAPGGVVVFGAEPITDTFPCHGEFVWTGLRSAPSFCSRLC
jgi:2-polyprenyl-3-methyl-5-hydroxy-6-metoxy-1,4-benzoquinol methylase